MSEEERNTAILKEAHQQWNDTKGGSIDHWLSLMEEIIDFRSLGDGDGGLNFMKQDESRADMRRYFKGLFESFEMIHYTMTDYIAQNDTVVAVGTCAWRALATGKTVECPKVDIVKFRDGKIIAFHEFFDTAKAQAALVA